MTLANAKRWNAYKNIVRTFECRASKLVESQQIWQLGNYKRLEGFSGPEIMAFNPAPRLQDVSNSSSSG